MPARAERTYQSVASALARWELPAGNLGSWRQRVKAMERARNRKRCTARCRTSDGLWHFIAFAPLSAQAILRTSYPSSAHQAWRTSHAARLTETVCGYDCSGGHWRFDRLLPGARPEEGICRRGRGGARLRAARRILRRDRAAPTARSSRRGSRPSHKATANFTSWDTLADCQGTAPPARTPRGTRPLGK